MMDHESEIKQKLELLVDALGLYVTALLEHTLINPAQCRVNAARGELVERLLEKCK